MRIMRLGNSLTVILLLISLLLGVTVAYQLKRLMESPAQVEPEDSAQTLKTGTQKGLPKEIYIPPTKSALNEILERPLFSQDRSPPEIPLETLNKGSVAKRAKFEFTLEGIVITPEKRIALVRDTKSNEILKLHEGSKHKGWLVDGVSTGRAVFINGDQNRELVFELERNPRKKFKKSRFRKSLGNKSKAKQRKLKNR